MSYMNAEQYHLKLVQRFYNENSNTMSMCNFPLIMCLANWMRWSEFNYLVYLQMNRFIADEIQFEEINDNFIIENLMDN